jgi:hypothetical protein
MPALTATPLRYPIGLAAAQGAPGALTVQGYDAEAPVKARLAAKYVNLRDENNDGLWAVQDAA